MDTEVLHEDVEKSDLFKEAELIRIKLQESKSTNITDYISLANIYFSLKKYAMAITQMIYVTTIDEDPSYLFILGHLYDLAGEYENAIDCKKRVIKLKGSEVTTMDLNGLADSLCLAGKVEDELVAREEILSCFPKENIQWVRLAALYVQLGFTEKAEHAALMALDNKVADSSVLEILANIHRLRNDLSNSIKYLELALKLSPNSSIILKALGFDYYTNKQYLKAERTLKRVYDMNVDKAEVCLFLAYLYSERGQFFKAIPLLTEAIQLKPDENIYYVQLGEAFRHIGDTQNALEQYSLAIEKGTKLAIAYLQKTIILFEAGEVEKAIKVIEEGLARIPDSDLACMSAYLYRNLYDREMEENRLRLALELNDNCIRAYVSLGDLYVRDFSKAELFYKKALEINANDTDANGRLGLLYAGYGRLNEALEHISKACEYDENSITWIINRALIEYDLEISTYNETLSKCYGLFKKSDNLIYILNNVIPRLLSRNLDNDVINIACEFRKILKETEYYHLSIVFELFSDNKIQRSLAKIQILVWKVLENLALTSKTKLCHYSEISSLKNMVKKEQEIHLRLSNASYMNDPSEGKALTNLLLKICPSNKIIQSICHQDEKDIINASSGEVFLFSLSSEIDKLAMWAQYGELGSGCCYIFESEFFDYDHPHVYDFNVYDKGEESIQDQLIPHKVVYLDEKNLNYSSFKRQSPKVYAFLEAICNECNELLQFINSNKTLNKVNNFVAEMLDQIRFLFKSIDYSYENESRLIKIANIHSSLITEVPSDPVPRLYLEIKKSKCLQFETIILGPKVRNVGLIMPYLLYTGKVGSVKKSTVPFR